MGIDPNVGGNIGFNVGGGGAPLPGAPVGGGIPPVIDESYLSTLSQSELDALIVNLISSFPMLGVFPFLNLFDNAAAGKFTKQEVANFIESLGQTKNAIVSAMLDAWAENVAKETELQREDALKTQERTEIEQNVRLKQDILNQDVTNAAAVPLDNTTHITDAANYETYLASLSIPRRAEEVGNIAHRIAEHYISVSNDPAVQNSDLAKAVLPLLVMETLVINPAVQQLMIMPGVNLSNQIGVNGIADQVQPAMNQLPTVFQDQTLLTINLFVMDMVKNATIDMYLKQGGDAATKPKDIEFATAFASQMLEKVRTPGYIEGELVKNAAGAEFLNGEQLQVAVALVKAFALLNAVMLFTKVEGGTLQENELKQMLTGQTNIPVGDNRGELLQEIKNILDSIPEKNQVDFATTLLKYVGSMPDTDRLTNWIHALNSAMEEVSPAQRAVQAPAT